MDALFADGSAPEMRMNPREPRQKTVAGGASMRLIALCGAVYFTSYLTRKCYEA